VNFDAFLGKIDHSTKTHFGVQTVWK